MAVTQNRNIPTIFLPDGRPAPIVLTDDEVITLLRLDGPHPKRTLKFWRDEGQLIGIRLGRHIRYPLANVLKFIAEKSTNGRTSCSASRIQPGRKTAREG